MFLCCLNELLNKYSICRRHYESRLNILDQFKWLLVVWRPYIFIYRERERERGGVNVITDVFNIFVLIININTDTHIQKEPIYITADAFIIHYGDVIMGTIASQITSLTIIYSTVYSDADQRKHQSSASLAFVWEFTGDRWIPRTNGQ